VDPLAKREGDGEREGTEMKTNGCGIEVIEPQSRKNMQKTRTIYTRVKYRKSI
jgi:hypothetical protein